MALSARLTQGGHPPEELRVRAVCTLDRAEGGYAITTMELDVGGRVPGIDEAAFQEAVRAAEQGCPVSKALSGNVAIRATGRLEQ
jgi:osmotically inducible protein OsmC